jgi:hypothetical protein
MYYAVVCNRKQNFTHPLFSVLSAIIKIAKPPSRHLEKATTTITVNLDRRQATDCWSIVLARNT